ncbi:MAG TPA: glutathione S-transferase family protein [Allocoleopsis sp.]
MTRTLYYSQRSPFARKVRIFLLEKNLDCELKAIEVMKQPPEFLQMSPIGKIPVFIDTDETIIWDSTLITEYLDETYPEPSFYPLDKKQKLECRKWEEIADTLCDNTIALWLQNNMADSPQVRLVNRYQSVITRLLNALEQKLTNSTYIVGENFTAADIATISFLGYYNLRFGSDWQTQYPHLLKLFNDLHEMESVKSTIPQG